LTTRPFHFSFSDAALHGLPLDWGFCCDGTERGALVGSAPLDWAVPSDKYIEVQLLFLRRPRNRPEVGIRPHWVSAGDVVRRERVFHGVRFLRRGGGCPCVGRERNVSHGQPFRFRPTREPTEVRGPLAQSRVDGTHVDAIRMWLRLSVVRPDSVTVLVRPSPEVKAESPCGRNTCSSLLSDWTNPRPDGDGHPLAVWCLLAY
jgi:hypothetical protein